MSRSFKKTPIIKSYRSGGKFFANKKVRRSIDIVNGNSYKKFYCRYDVYEMRDYTSKQDWINSWKLEESSEYTSSWRHKHWKNFEEYMQYWRNLFYWK